MKKLFFLIIFIASLVGLSFYGNYQSFLQKEIIQEDNFILEIEDGNTFYSLADKLGIDKNLLKVYLKLNPPNFDLQTGNYSIPQKMTIEGIIENLKKPMNKDVKITLLEGRNIYDIDTCLSNPSYFYIKKEDETEQGCLYYENETGEKSFMQEGLIEAGEFIGKAQGDFENFRLDFSFLKNVETLEGYLYPDTYNINPNAFTLDGFIYMLLKNFNNKVIMNLEKDYSSEELLKIITLASIVEKEEKNSAEKARVAGVLKKRLSEGWMLGADATVCYPYALTSEECKMVVSKYIAEKNDYNTRTMLGLPATPITNPSAETIFATIKSEETPYYFYLHGSDGVIHYAIDNAGHEANKAKYLK